MTAAHTLAESLAGAARVVARVLGGASLTAVLAPSGRRTLDPAVQDLSYATLRDYAVGDALLGKLAHKRVDDVELRALLLVAFRELAAARAAPYTIVDQAVEAASALGLARAKGLVNAVLRGYLRDRAALDRGIEADEPVRYRHPTWWIERVRQDHPAGWASILEAGNAHPPMTLRVNRRRTAVENYLAHLDAIGIEAKRIGPLALRLARPCPVNELPGFADGQVSVQDAGAQLAAPLLDLAPGMHVLDACAAPGGKSAHLLETADIALTALDVDTVRLRRVTDTLARLGLTAKVLAGDAAEPAAWWDGRLFDRVLCDAPCSASGVVRRHPDIKWLRRAADVPRFARAQARLLDALWQVLAPGGKLLYATCSVFREENAAGIDVFLGGQPEARVLAVPGTGELLPGPEHDGFYYALLAKQ